MGKLSALPGMDCTKYDEREEFPNPFRRRFVLLTFDLHVCIQIGNEAFFLLHDLQFHSFTQYDWIALGAGARRVDEAPSAYSSPIALPNQPS